MLMKLTIGLSNLPKTFHRSPLKLDFQSPLTKISEKVGRPTFRLVVAEHSKQHNLWPL